MKHKPVLNDNGEFSGSSITRAAQACYESEIKYSVALFTLVKNTNSFLPLSFTLCRRK